MDPRGGGTRCRSVATPDTAWAALLVEERGHPERHDTTLLVDRSASMRSAVADGSLATLVEAVVGLASVIGRRDPVRVGLAGRLVTWLPPVRGPELPAAVATALEDGGYLSLIHI